MVVREEFKLAPCVYLMKCTILEFSTWRSRSVSPPGKDEVGLLLMCRKIIMIEFMLGEKMVLSIAKKKKNLNS